MKMIGWNCQGAGKGLDKSKKMDYLANLMSSTRAQVCFISETKSFKYSSSKLNNRFNIADSFVVPSKGRSGGLWMLWSDEVCVTVKFFNQYMILAIVVDRATNIDFVLACIYGDPHHRQTDMIWDNVYNFVCENLGKPVVCLGDLNNIMCDMDTTSINVNKVRMRIFNSYVKRCGLFDLGFSGPAYTWTNKRFASTPVFERLDRCLANAEWCSLFPNTNVFNLPIILSDHAPILISTESKYQRPKLNLKFENWWTYEEDFQDVAKNAWTASTNRPFHARTTNLAGTLKKWCKKKKSIQQQLDHIQEQINEIQMQPVQLQDHNLEVSLIAQYEQNMTKLTEYYRQRAKKHWATQGDRNTAFFHNAVQKRKRRNRIVSIRNAHGHDLFDPEDIASEFVHYFKSIFRSSATNNDIPTLNTTLRQDPEDYTNSMPDKQEIWGILKEMRKNASPGPDGFNVAFYTSAWDWIGDDVTNVVRNFYTTAVLPPHLNATHIALIPKKLACHLPSDFRPISLCNVVYKIIAKSLANRLKHHFPDYIHPSQQAFIEGRQISNNVIVAQEIAHSFTLTSWKSLDFMLKIDLAKAFDRVEWHFIVSALARKGLHGHFINLVHACISSPTFLVIINGQSFAKFGSSRGIRQGCPLSPYLFVFAVNELALTLQDALHANHLTGISLGQNCPPIHSLMFADDLIICGKANVQEAHTISQIIDHFCHDSGQTPNWSKSGILFSKNVTSQVKEDIRAIFPAPDIDNSFVHLGHPLILPSKDRSAAYTFIYDKFRSKLSTYKANRLSHATRLTLIKSVFSSIPVYYMSNILFSKKFLAKLTAIIRNFWWTGVQDDQTTRSLCLRAWADICIDKSIGGLGIRNLQAINQGLILSTAWRLAKEPHSQIAQILKAKYHHDTSIWRAKGNKPKSAFWSAILKVWSDNQMAPRIQTFAWRLLRKALPTGKRASRYSKHINESCSRCGNLEDEMHIFFLCPFSKAAWYCYPWFIKIELIAEHHPSIPDLIKALLASQHPQLNCTNLYTFLWCLWKARNDTLFCRKVCKPSQVFAAANAIMIGAAMEIKEMTIQQMNDLPRDKQQGMQPSSQLQEVTNSTTTAIYCDAAWEKQIGNDRNQAGIGITINMQGNQHLKQIHIAALSPPASSPLQAETYGLLLATKLAHLLQVQDPQYFTDCLVLASTARAPSVFAAPGHWENRHLLAEIQASPSFDASRITHVRRCDNVKADHLARLALRIQNRTLAIRCLGSEADSCPARDILSVSSVNPFTLLSVKCV